MTKIVNLCLWFPPEVFSSRLAIHHLQDHHFSPTQYLRSIASTAVLQLTRNPQNAPFEDLSVFGASSFQRLYQILPYFAKELSQRSTGYPHFPNCANATRISPKQPQASANPFKPTQAKSGAHLPLN